MPNIKTCFTEKFEKSQFQVLLLVKQEQKYEFPVHLLLCKSAHAVKIS